MPVKYKSKKFNTRLEAVDAALEHMDWLTPADDAQVDVARAYAIQIDDFCASDDPAIKAKGAYLLPQLQNALAALGGSPESRKELGAKDEDDEDPKEAQMKKLRESRGKKTK